MMRVTESFRCHIEVSQSLILIDIDCFKGKKMHVIVW
jgi:hypothetical protein